MRGGESPGRRCPRSTPFREPSTLQGEGIFSRIERLRGGHLGPVNVCNIITGLGLIRRRRPKQQGWHRPLGQYRCSASSAGSRSLFDGQRRRSPRPRRITRRTSEARLWFRWRGCGSLSCGVSPASGKAGRRASRLGGRSCAPTPKQIVVGPWSTIQAGQRPLRFECPTHTFSEVPGGAPCKCTARGLSQGFGVL